MWHFGGVNVVQRQVAIQQYRGLYYFGRGNFSPK